ncbi:MAG: hypothetical protein M0R77_19145 [Gammaproteobacteria bacterium]|nr:hypothetical protein [Gammaproteobacteria bacterium]
MTLTAKDSESLFLKSGDKMTVVATGSCNVARFVGNELGSVFTVTSDYPVTTGPLTTDSTWLISCISGSATVTKTTQDAVITRVIITTEALLPTYGETGVIYETEAGWKRWDELTGAFLAVVSGVPLAPVATTGSDPVIAGATVVGSVLSVTSNGGWSGRPTSYTYQWQADGVDITGETDSTYTTLVGDVDAAITCLVKGVNAVAAATTASTSNSITVTAAP